MKGMNKITRGPKPLRVLWLSFVTTMSIVLIVASCLLIRDFMLYDVNINTEVRLDSETLFPSITICHHHPFSFKAYQLWKDNKIISPSDFNRKMRDLAHEELLKKQISKAESIINYDGISIYYQNLDYNNSLLVGHQQDIFLSCMNLKDNMISFEDDCFKLEGYKVKRFSHHEHFNCYTFEAQVHDISLLGIIVSMGPAPDYSNTEQAFIVDTFRQAQGLKVFIHEPETPPDIENAGIHVEPGKMNEITYRPIEWELANTPKKPCVDNNVAGKYKDLELMYKYTQDLCLRSARQAAIIRKCKCMFIYNPRSQIPTNDIPYCGNFIEDFNFDKLDQRITCLQELEEDELFKKELESKKCFKRCNYINYETSISITKWRATEWHLHWIRLQVLTFRQLRQISDHSNITDSEYFHSWLSYYNATNLTLISEDKKEKFLANENFTYIVLRQESRNSVRKYERLVITPYVLVSRIGGLCSLTVGITASFFVEILEFLYLYYQSNKSKKTQTQEEAVYHKHQGLPAHIIKKSSMKTMRKGNLPNILKCEFKDFSEPIHQRNQIEHIKEILL